VSISEEALREERLKAISAFLEVSSRIQALVDTGIDADDEWEQQIALNHSIKKANETLQSYHYARNEPVVLVSSEHNGYGVRKVQHRKTGEVWLERFGDGWVWQRVLPGSWCHDEIAAILG
jgi:hypothetical protein